MPANRSRTEHWRESLNKVLERGGALEISIDRSSELPDNLPPGVQGDICGHDEAYSNSTGPADLVWRVRIVRLTDTSITVESPSAFGSSVRLEPGVRLVAAMQVGQNRWMFHTYTLGLVNDQGTREPAVVLQMPTDVERCTRRSFFRTSTANLKLPSVQCWPLLDPGSTGAAEAANRAQIKDLLVGRADPVVGNDPGSLLLPEVGPLFPGSLLNISGGGLGVAVAHTDTAALSSKPFVWLRLDLRPEIPAPIAVTARVCHSHLDSRQQVNVGLAFDFTHNPEHQRFVIELLGGYIEQLQRSQRAAAARRAA